MTRAQMVDNFETNKFVKAQASVVVDPASRSIPRATSDPHKQQATTPPTQNTSTDEDSPSDETIDLGKKVGNFEKKRFCKIKYLRGGNFYSRIISKSFF